MTRQFIGQVVTDWLRADASSSGSDRILAATLVSVATVQQEHRRPTWWRPPPRWWRPRLDPTLDVAVAVVVVLTVVFASFDVLSTGRDVQGGATVGPTPVPASTMARCPQDPGPQPAGPQSITLFSSIWVTVTLPESSLGGCWQVTTAGRVDPVWWASFGQDLGTLGAHPGGIGITTADPVPAGCEGFPGWDRAEVAIDGFTGERYDYRGPFQAPFTDCHPNGVVDQLGETSGRGPDTLLTLWVLDVDGERLSLFAWIKSLDHQRQAELQRLVESVQIEVIAGQ